jgi:hypothetical protein
MKSLRTLWCILLFDIQVTDVGATEAAPSKIRSHLNWMVKDFFNTIWLTAYSPKNAHVPFPLQSPLLLFVNQTTL